MKESFVFYRSFYESINKLDDEIKLEIFNAICEYSLNEKELELSVVADAIFTLIKPNIDSANKRYIASVENGKKGGRPKKNDNLEKPKKNLKKPSNNLEKPKQNLNVNDNVDVNVNYNDNNKRKYIKEKYGKYKRITLTSDEYLRLVNEYGEDFINKQIEYLDEYVQSNNNKNKYKDFNLVLRKSIRDNWFKNKQKGSNNIFLDIMKEDYYGG